MVMCSVHLLMYSMMYCTNQSCVPFSYAVYQGEDIVFERDGAGQLRKLGEGAFGQARASSTCPGSAQSRTLKYVVRVRYFQRGLPTCQDAPSLLCSCSLMASITVYCCEISSTFMGTTDITKLPMSGCTCSFYAIPCRLPQLPLCHLHYVT